MLSFDTPVFHGGRKLRPTHDFHRKKYSFDDPYVVVRFVNKPEHELSLTYDATENKHPYFYRQLYLMIIRIILVK